MSVQSPCISICVLDEQDVCQGCFRTAAEITQWSTASEQAQSEILACSKVRRLNDQKVVFK